MKKNELIKDIMYSFKMLTAYETKIKYGEVTDIISIEMDRKEKKKHPKMNKKSIIEEVERDLKKMRSKNIANMYDDIVCALASGEVPRHELFGCCSACRELEVRVSKVESTIKNIFLTDGKESKGDIYD